MHLLPVLLLIHLRLCALNERNIRVKIILATVFLSTSVETKTIICLAVTESRQQISMMENFHFSAGITMKYTKYRKYKTQSIKRAI